MAGEFRGRVVIVTGSGSGLGRELARRLSAEGAKVGGIDLRPGDVGDARTTADVTDVVALRAAVAELEQALGPADVMIASAGLGRGTPATAWRAEDVNAILSVNLLGVVNAIDAVLAGMRARRSGHLVVLSSLASYRGMPHMAAYSASKAGCNALCDSLRVELADEGVAVTCVCPGWVRTPMTESIGVPAKMLMPLDAAAARIVEAIRRRSRFVAFPWSVAWQAWLLRSLPRPIGDWLAGQFLRRVRKLQGR